MRNILPILLLAALPAQAQQDTPEQPAIPFLEEWAERTEEMMRELMQEIGPEMDELMVEIVPHLQDLSERIGGLMHYEMPQMLPNGDIIIRRKPDAPPLPPDFMPDNDPIDL